jgi:signal transduction histidine kinase
MKFLDLGKTKQERQEIILVTIFCMSVAIFATDLFTPYGFMIWILYLIPVLMTVWLPYRTAPFATASLLMAAIFFAGFIATLQYPLTARDLPNRAVFSVMLAIVPFLAWEIRTAYENLEREVTERQQAQGELQDLTKMLEQKVQKRTSELTEVNKALAKDIEERKKIEEALSTAHHKLSLLSGITRHDILNQIFALLTYITLSLDFAQNGTPLKEHLRRMEGISRTIEKQIMFTRDYENIGAQAPFWHHVDNVISQAANEANVADVLLDIAVGPLQVYADPMFGKVFYALIENALRHGEKVTKIDFSFRQSGDDLIIVYQDNGVGIAAEDKPKLFQKGFGKHTGLGLFLSREILSITKIAITENGEPGNGARFEMTVQKGMYRFGDG